MDRGNAAGGNVEVEYVLSGGKVLYAILTVCFRARAAIGFQGTGVGGADVPVVFAVVDREHRKANVGELLLIHDADEVDEGGLAIDGTMAEQQADGVGRVFGDWAAIDGEPFATIGDGEIAQRGWIILAVVVDVVLDVLLPDRERNVLRIRCAAAG